MRCVGAEVVFVRAALLRENRACTLFAESFTVSVCPLSTDAVRAESAPPVTRITGRIGRMQGEIPVIRPPSMPRMMSDNSIVIFLLDCSYGAMLPRVLSWLYSEQTAVSVWSESFLWRPLHTWRRFHVLSYCAILQPMKFLWGCSRMAANASFKKFLRFCNPNGLHAPNTL